MPSGVNNRAIANTTNAHDWPLPELQANLPASSTAVVMSDKYVTANNSGRKHRKVLQDVFRASSHAWEQ